MSVILDKWINALDNYAQALKNYVDIIDEWAKKSRPSSRKLYQNAISESEDVLKSDFSIPNSKNGEKVAEAAFNIFYKLERLREELDKGTNVALDPVLLNESTHRMSRSYSDDIENKTRDLISVRTKVAETEKICGNELSHELAPKIIKEDPQKIYDIYSAASKQGLQSTISSTLFSIILKKWRENKNIDSIIENSKDKSLNIKVDTSENISSDIESRKKMHPLQAMGITFNLYFSNDNNMTKSTESNDQSKILINATLPQTNTVVRYNIEPLIDIKEALKFGSLANTLTGLNYRVINRLKTITERRISKNKEETPIKISIDEDKEEGISRTIDNGITYQKAKIDFEDKYKSIGAGPKHRVERIGELLNDALMKSDDEDTPKTIKDPEKLLKNYDDQVDSVASYISIDELVQTLIQKFGETYEELKPKSMEQYKLILIGEYIGCHHSQSYIARSIIDVSKRGIEKKLLKSEASGEMSLSLLFGSRKKAIKGGRQETLLSTFVQLNSSISAIAGRLSKAYEKLLLNTKKELKDKMEALILYRSIINEAFFREIVKKSKVVEKLNSVEPRTNLKLYVLDKGDTSRV